VYWGDGMRVVSVLDSGAMLGSRVGWSVSFGMMSAVSEERHAGRNDLNGLYLGSDL
jgi:hypothetical protein